MKSDLELKDDVACALAWDPAVHAPGIGVSVRDGVVTVRGELESLAERKAIDRAVRRVAGVLGVALELEVKPSPAQRRGD